MIINNVVRLARSKLRHGWKIHLAAMFLTALTCAAYLIYQSYLSQMGTSFGKQVQPLELLSDAYVDLPPGHLLSDPAVPTGTWRSDTAPTAVAAARRVELGTDYGRLTGMSLKPYNGYNGPLPDAGEAILPESIVERLGIPLGEPFEVVLLGTEYKTQLTITGTYDVSPAGETILLAADFASPLLNQPGYNRFLYSSAQGKEDQARSFFSRFYPDATVLDRNQPSQLAKMAVNDVYGTTSGVALLGFVFLAFGVLTALLLSFLDSKRELSVLKSLGLTPIELWGVFVSTGISTAFLGVLLGLGLAYAISTTLALRNVDLPVQSIHLVPMLLRTLAAYVVAIAVPAGFAKRATVNQLLFDQPIPLVSKTVHTLKKRHVIFESQQAAGWQVMRLPVVDGKLEGFLFKYPGDRVKNGEVLAYSPGWWGLTYTEYVASIDGVVGFYNDGSGFIGIKPDDGKKKNPGLD